MTRTWVTIAMAGLVVIAGILAAPLLFDRLDTSLDPAAHTEAERTEVALIELTGTDSQLVALLEEPIVDLEVLTAEVQSLDGTAAAALVPSQTVPGSVLVSASVTSRLDDDERETLLADFAAIVDGTAATVTIGGSLALDEELGSTAESDLLVADALTIPIVLVLFGVVFRRLRVALIPLAIVVVVVTGSLAMLLALSALTTVSVFAVNVVTLFGVGLAIDYGLLIVARFDEEMATNADVDCSLAATRATAGRAVIYSGLTVSTSLTALLVFAEPVLRSLAYGGIAATSLAVAAAHWLLPPLLRRHGRHVGTVDPPDADRGRIADLARRIQSRPRVVAATTVAVLIVLAAPITSIAFEGLDARSLPDSSPIGYLTDRLATTHPDLPLAPVQVLVQAPPEMPATQTLSDEIASLPAVHALTTTPLGEATLLTVNPPGAATDALALDLVNDIRAIDSEAEFGVTGEAAEEVDLLASIGHRLPYAAALLAALNFLLLLVFTRAPVVAIKAVAINTLSVAAAFGLLVLFFQQGALAGLLGFEPIGALSAVILLVTFAFAFGLSMDYEVFLLARIREHYDICGDNDLAVRRGLQQSGRLVTQAAALIIILFVGFALGDLLLIQQLGIGLALAVAVDATIVRLILVPALMTVLGDTNWWTPTGKHHRNQQPDAPGRPTSSSR